MADVTYVSRVRVEVVEGRVRNVVGGATGDSSEQLKGKAKELAGKAKRAAGKRAKRLRRQATKHAQKAKRLRRRARACGGGSR